MRAARAWMVRPGLAEPWVGMTEPSMMKRLSMSQVRPNLSQTPVSGVALMRAAPTRWAKRDS